MWLAAHLAAQNCSERGITASMKQHEEHEDHSRTQVVLSFPLTAIPTHQVLSLPFICGVLLTDRQPFICLIVDEERYKDVSMDLV
jgi:hypothetical protein